MTALVGPRNAELAVGLPWRRVREHARRLGLRPVRIGRAHCYRLAELLDTLDTTPANEGEQDGRAMVLEAIRGQR